jgi:CBS domain-containing protein
VDEQGRAVGLVSVVQLEALAPAQRAAERVLDIADRDPQLTVAEDEDVARLLERPAFARSGRAVVVDERGRPIGLVSITDVQRSLRASRLTNRAPSVAAPV